MTPVRPDLGRFKPPKMPSLEEAVLTGGLHAVAVRRPTIPMVEVRLVLPLPARHIARQASPLVLSEAMLAGTAQHDREELSHALERLGGTLSVALAGDRLVIGTSALAASLEEMMALLADVLTGATYPAGEVEAERERTADQMSVFLSRPEALADEAFGHRLFGRHPYAAELPRPDAVLRVSAPSLRRLHHEVVQPGDAHLVLAGDVQPRRGLALIESALGGWLDAGDTVDTSLPPVLPVRPGGILLVDRPGSVQSNLRMGGNAPTRTADDWAATSLANLIFGGMFTSRLVTNLRERHGYTYSPRSGVDHGRAGSTSSISAEVATEVTAAAIVEARYELGRMATTGVTEDELESARRYGVGSFLYQTATSAGLASVLATLAGAGIEPGYLTEHPARLTRATKEQVDEAARRYLAPGRMATVVVGDAARITSELEAVDEVTVAS